MKKIGTTQGGGTTGNQGSITPSTPVDKPQIPVITQGGSTTGNQGSSTPSTTQKSAAGAGSSPSAPVGVAPEVPGVGGGSTEYSGN
jgi:hypothetical protein